METIEGIRRVGVVGAGTMGHGIAQVAAQAGYEVLLCDLTSEQVEGGLGRVRQNLDRGVDKGKVAPAAREQTLARLRGTTSRAELASGSDLIIEAIPESLALKQALFRDLEASARPDAILATNTSALGIDAIAGATNRPERLVGMHFFNPVHLMKLVEVVRGARTTAATVEIARQVALRMGKQPIVVRDSPGFASSRLGLVLGLEAMRMLEAGVASAEDIDRAMTLGYGHPMGPLQLTDLVGLDVRLAIAEHLERELGPAFAPPPILRRKVSEGKLGKKTGEGFYRWEGDAPRAS